MLTIKDGLAAGTPDKATGSALGALGHFFTGDGHIGHDVQPFSLARQLDEKLGFADPKNPGPNLKKYLKLRPPCNGGGKCYKSQSTTTVDTDRWKNSLNSL
jgi:hypothetical protein